MDYLKEIQRRVKEIELSIWVYYFLNNALIKLKPKGFVKLKQSILITISFFYKKNALMQQHFYSLRNSSAAFIVGLLLFSATILRGQTQYIGANNGDWATATNPPRTSAKSRSG